MFKDRWNELFKIYKNELYNEPEENIIVITDVKTLDVECIMVPRIDSTNQYLEFYTSRLEYEII